MGIELLELTVMTAWGIWFSRNKTRMGATCQTSHEIMAKARFPLMEYQEAHLRPTQFKDATDKRWVPPVFPLYKVNVDVVVFSHLGMIGVGVVIRDHEGTVIASKRLPLPLGPLEAEAKALDEASIFAWDVGVKDVIFETNSSPVSHALANPTDAQTSIAHIVTGTRFRLQDFCSFECSHVSRQANKPAHILAVYAKDIDFLVTGMEKCPPFIESLVVRYVIIFF